jgi:hypothetical protein
LKIARFSAADKAWDALGCSHGLDPKYFCIGEEGCTCYSCDPKSRAKRDQKEIKQYRELDKIETELEEKKQEIEDAFS